jgi:excisionase family DNA binding protein
MTAPTDGAGEIFSIRQLAAYLMVSEKTLYRMVERRQIPGVRVGSQWRFRRSDIEAWLSEQVRQMEYERKSGVAEELGASEVMEIAPFLQAENVWLNLPVVPRDELLAAMVEGATLDPHVDKLQLAASIQKRENLCSTALLDAVAFPHPVAPEEFRFTRKRLLVATLERPIDFGDPHGHRPSIVCVLLARSLRGHLFALSRALKLFGDPRLAESLRAAASPADLVARLSAFERVLAPA